MSVDLGIDKRMNCSDCVSSNVFQLSLSLSLSPAVVAIYMRWHCSSYTLLLGCWSSQPAHFNIIPGPYQLNPLAWNSWRECYQSISPQNSRDIFKVKVVYKHHNRSVWLWARKKGFSCVFHSPGIMKQVPNTYTPDGELSDCFSSFGASIKRC